jgi:predicted small secreted protein
MKKIAAFLAIAFTLSIPLAGCNTMKGAGQDIQQGGQKLEDKAEKKQ